MTEPDCPNCEVLRRELKAAKAEAARLAGTDGYRVPSSDGYGSRLAAARQKKVAGTKAQVVLAAIRETGATGANAGELTVRLSGVMLVNSITARVRQLLDNDEVHYWPDYGRKSPITDAWQRVLFAGPQPPTRPDAYPVNFHDRTLPGRQRPKVRKVPKPAKGARVSAPTRSPDAPPWVEPTLFDG